MRFTTHLKRTLFLTNLLGLMLGNSRAASCTEKGGFYQNLPISIGKEDQVGKMTYVLKCDTVFVRRGVTTIIYPGTMLYFASPSLSSVIKVEGTLLIKGSKNSYVTLSGSIDSSRYGVEPGNRQWGGIEVSEGGRLEIEFAGFMKAPTPITAFSKQVKILNSWFKGSTGINLPDGNLFKMESKWQAINELDLNKSNSEITTTERPKDAISDKEKAALLDHAPSDGFWTWKKVAGGAAALAIVGVGASFYMTPDKTTTQPEKPVTINKVSLIDKVPGFPSEK